MAVPGIPVGSMRAGKVAALTSEVAEHNAAVIARMRDRAGAMGRPPPPLPPPPPSPPPAPDPVALARERRVQDFAKRSGALEPAAPGMTRMYRAGEVPSHGRPARNPDDYAMTLWGQRLTWKQLDELKGGNHANPVDASGRWFTDAADELDYYVRENDTDPVYYVDVPEDYAKKYNVRNTPFMKNSRNPDREFVLPPDVLPYTARLLDGLRQ